MKDFSFCLFLFLIITKSHVAVNSSPFSLVAIASSSVEDTTESPNRKLQSEGSYPNGNSKKGKPSKEEQDSYTNQSDGSYSNGTSKKSKPSEEQDGCKKQTDGSYSNGSSKKGKPSQEEQDGYKKQTDGSYYNGTSKKGKPSQEEQDGYKKQADGSYYTGNSKGKPSQEQQDWAKDRYKELDFDPNGSGEKTMAALNPIDTITVKKINDEAFAETQNLYPQANKHNDEADAFRHAYFSARLTQELGAEEAKNWGDAHERSNPNPVEERVMDLNNNQEGRNIGRNNPKANRAQTSRAVRKAIKSGDSGIMTRPPSSASGVQDPHLVGFDGSRFDFYGLDGMHYLLFGQEAGGGDRLVARMRGVPAKHRMTSFFDAFGLVIGDNGSRLSVELTQEPGSTKWAQTVQLNGKRMAEEDLVDGPVHIAIRQDSVMVTTSQHTFFFRGGRLGNQERRHQDVTVRLNHAASGDYRGILGVTLNRAIGTPVHQDFRDGSNAEMNLRRHFQVSSLFPRSDEAAMTNPSDAAVHDTRPSLRGGRESKI